MIGTKRILVAAAAVALGVAALVPTVTWAASAGQAPGTDDVAAHFGVRGQRLQALADALGVTTDQLSAALQSVRDALRPAEPPTAPPTPEERAAKQAAFESALATQLGLTTDQVHTALESLKPTAEQVAAAQAQRRDALKSRLDEAVANGKITQDQEDAILAAFDAGVFPGLAGHGPRRLRPAFGGFGGARGFGGPGGFGQGGL